MHLKVSRRKENNTTRIAPAVFGWRALYFRHCASMLITLFINLRQISETS